MQVFKETDVKEGKVIAAFDGLFSALDTDRDSFYEGAYGAQALGALIWDSKRSPLANAIVRDIFILSFNELFESFQNAGTFESYLSVFRKIFGEDVEVSFTIPGPGKLNIGITAAGLEESYFVARVIEDNAYTFPKVVTQDDENIVFTSVKGFTSQYELEQMLFEMVSGGVFTQITLAFG